MMVGYTFNPKWEVQAGKIGQIWGGYEYERKIHSSCTNIATSWATWSALLLAHKWYLSLLLRKNLVCKSPTRTLEVSNKNMPKMPKWLAQTQLSTDNYFRLATCHSLISFKLERKIFFNETLTNPMGMGMANSG